VFQFVKSGKWVSGERLALETLHAEHQRSGIGGPIEFVSTGTRGRWIRTPADEPEQAAAAQRAWSELQEQLRTQRHDLYILDEFTYPLTWGWLDTAEVVRAFAQRPGRQHLVVTGRQAPAELREIATTVTEMTKIKHPFESGQKGQAGIEW